MNTRITLRGLALVTATSGLLAGSAIAGKITPSKDVAEPAAAAATNAAPVPAPAPAAPEAGQLDESETGTAGQVPPVDPSKEVVVPGAAKAKAPSAKALTVEVAAPIAAPPLTGSGLLLALDAGGAKNVIVSPASVRSALEILLPGAPVEVQAQYGALTPLRNAPELTEANALWIGKGFDAKPDFVQMAATRAFVERIDFATQGVAPINAWVAKATEGKVTDLLSDLPPSAEMVATNALLFKGLWSDAFDPEDTSKGAFKSASGTEVEADFMQGSARPLLRMKNGLATSLTTRGGMRVVFMLPDEGVDAAGAAKALEVAALSGNDAFAEEGPIVLPRYALEDANSMTEALRAIGYGFLLDTPFDGIAPSGPRISDVMQKVAVEIDEKGATAAAATAAVLNRSLVIEPEPVVFDRPFWFAITEGTPTGPSSVIFAGYVASPISEGGSYEKP